MSNINVEVTDMGMVLGCEEGIISFTIKEAKELKAKLNKSIEEYEYKKQAEDNANSMGV